MSLDLQNVHIGTSLMNTEENFYKNRKKEKNFLSIAKHLSEMNNLDVS